MASYQIFDLDGATTVFPVNSFGAVEKSQLSLKLTDEDGVASYIAADQWSVNGYGEDSESITITWANAVNYTAPATLRIVKSVRTDMLATFGSGPTTDKKLQDEFANIITNMIIPMLGANNAAADLIFGAGNWNDDANGNWDGSDTISIGGDTNIVDILTTHETRLDTAETDIDALDVRLTTAESDIDAVESVNTTQDARLTSAETNLSALNDAAGFPNPFSVAAQDVTVGDSGGYFTAAQVEAVLQEMAANSVKWAGGARIDNGPNAGEILAGTALFKEGNFEYTGTPSATKFTTTRPGNNHFYIYPPTGTTPSNYVVQMFKYVAGTTSLEATADLLIWDSVNSRWDITMSSTLAIYFLKVL